jgi:hypothetical protein
MKNFNACLRPDAAGLGIPVWRIHSQSLYFPDEHRLWRIIQSDRQQTHERSLTLDDIGVIRKGHRSKSCERSRIIMPRVNLVTL